MGTITHPPLNNNSQKDIFSGVLITAAPASNNNADNMEKLDNNKGI